MIQSPEPRRRPEHAIQKAIIRALELRGWFVKSTHGSAFQSGFPDLYATHKLYGARWIEVKLPGMKGSKFTTAQLLTFPKLRANGSGVWILTGASDSELEKLRKPSNLWEYM